MQALRTIALLGWICMTAGCGPGPAPEPTAEPSSGPSSDPSGTPQEKHEPDGIYDYRSVAGDGAVIGSLALQFDRAETPAGAPVRVSGSWELASEGVVGEVGPQLGSGQLAGEFHPDGSIRLGLNPGMFDNNVTLMGTIDPSGHSFSGSWEYTNFTGPVTGGSFDADQR